MINSDTEHTDLLIVRVLEGCASDLESDELEEWILQSSSNRSYYMKMKNLWESAAHLPVDTEKALGRVLNRIGPVNKSVSFIQILYRIAAVLFVPLLITSLWLAFGRTGGTVDPENTDRQVIAPFGSLISFNLPDGTKVWLNTGSTLTYPEKFDEQSRTVLLSGEAYFEVHSDEQHPFYVKAKDLTVKATGTRFNVMAYDDCSTPSVALVEGKVAVMADANSDRRQQTAVLRPDQQLRYERSAGRFQIATGDSYKYIAWKDGKLVFRDDPLSEVARRISLQYNVDIIISDEVIRSYRYRATFENEPLSELLRLLKLSAPIDYSEETPVMNQDGSYGKRRIRIFATEK